MNVKNHKLVVGHLYKTAMYLMPKYFFSYVYKMTLDFDLQIKHS